MFFENNEESLERWYFDIYKDADSADGLHDYWCVQETKGEAPGAATGFGSWGSNSHAVFPNKVEITKWLERLAWDSYIVNWSPGHTRLSLWIWDYHYEYEIITMNMRLSLWIWDYHYEYETITMNMRLLLWILDYHYEYETITMNMRLSLWIWDFRFSQLSPSRTSLRSRRSTKYM